MARGQVAKDTVLSKIQSAFGDSVIGIYDKKLYVWADDAGEKVQVAISLTCPKNPVGENIAEVNGGFDFSGANTVIAPTKFEPAEITQEEQDRIATMMAQLGL
jgi:hypothetical protein